MQAQNNSYLHITELSRDQDLLSLFKQCQSMLHNDQCQQNYRVVDLSVDVRDMQRDYHSDQEIKDKRYKKIKTNKLIINKRQQRIKKKRTKNYIKVLQQKIVELTCEIQRLKKLNKVNKQYIHRLNQSEHAINGYFVGRQQVIEKLQALNVQQNVQSQKIHEEIISLRLRQGVFGKDRIKAVNYYFKQMVQMILPQNQKYIVKTAIQQQDFFDINYLNTGVLPYDVEDWRKVMLQKIGAQIKQKDAKYFYYNNRQKLITEAQKFKQILLDFSRTKCKLIQQAKKLQQVQDGVHSYMKVHEISKSLCYIDKYRFEKNISLQHTFRQVFHEMQSKNYSYEIKRPFSINV